VAFRRDARIVLWNNLFDFNRSIEPKVMDCGRFLTAPCMERLLDSAGHRFGVSGEGVDKGTGESEFVATELVSG
jgi:hypothetical protein